jgi:geranylgeranyl reductase family protein
LNKIYDKKGEYINPLSNIKTSLTSGKLTILRWERDCRMNYDVLVIGGGPAGCRTAGLIAEKGYKVLVAEEHRNIGEPMQCAGLVSPRTLKTANVPCNDIIINKIHGAYVHAPGGEILAIRGKETYGLVIDRSAFDRRLCDAARQAGAEIMTGTRAVVKDYYPEGVQVVLKTEGGERDAAASLLIGADGPNSEVARRINARRPDDIVSMYAAEVELKCPESDMVHIFLGEDVAAGWFGWLIPVDGKRARVGTGVSRSRNGRPQHCFRRMVEAYPDIFKGMQMIRGTGGIVPIGFPSRIYGERTLLVGDAACQTKPLSGGGLYLGLTGAGICSKVAADALFKRRFGMEQLAQYQNAWEKEMEEEIQTALSHRNIFLNMKDDEINMLIRFFNRPLWKYIISKYGDIDYPSWLAYKLSFARPWAEKFVLSRLEKMVKCGS